MKTIGITRTDRTVWTAICGSSTRLIGIMVLVAHAKRAARLMNPVENIGQNMSEYTYTDVEVDIDNVCYSVAGDVTYEFEEGQNESWLDPPYPPRAVSIRATHFDSITFENKKGQLIDMHKLEWFPQKMDFYNKLRQAVEGQFEGDELNNTLVQQYSEY